MSVFWSDYEVFSCTLINIHIYREFKKFAIICSIRNNEIVIFLVGKKNNLSFKKIEGYVLINGQILFSIRI